MKTVLLKPQREIMNSVLAYQDEGDDDQDCSGSYWYANNLWFANWPCDAFCEDYDCWYEEDAGSCTLVSDGNEESCY